MESLWGKISARRWANNNPIVISGSLSDCFVACRRGLEGSYSNRPLRKIVSRRARSGAIQSLSKPGTSPSDLLPQSLPPADGLTGAKFTVTGSCSRRMMCLLRNNLKLFMPPRYCFSLTGGWWWCGGRAGPPVGTRFFSSSPSPCLCICLCLCTCPCLRAQAARASQAKRSNNAAPRTLTPEGTSTRPHATQAGVASALTAGTTRGATASVTPEETPHATTSATAGPRSANAAETTEGRKQRRRRRQRQGRQAGRPAGRREGRPPGGYNVGAGQLVKKFTKVAIEYILDEAAAATVPEALQIWRNDRPFIMGGDPFQLLPATLSAGARYYGTNHVVDPIAPQLKLSLLRLAMLQGWPCLVLNRRVVVMVVIVIEVTTSSYSSSQQVSMPTSEVSPQCSSGWRLSHGRLSQRRLSQRRPSHGRLSNGRLSQSRVSQGRVSQRRVSQRRMSQKRLSQGRLSHRRVSHGRLSQRKPSQRRLSQRRLRQGESRKDKETIHLL